MAYVQYGNLVAAPTGNANGDIDGLAACFGGRLPNRIQEFLLALEASVLPYQYEACQDTAKKRVYSQFAIFTIGRLPDEIPFQPRSVVSYIELLRHHHLPETYLPLVFSLDRDCWLFCNLQSPSLEICVVKRKDDFRRFVRIAESLEGFISGLVPDVSNFVRIYKKVDMATLSRNSQRFLSAIFGPEWESFLREQMVQHRSKSKRPD